MATSVHGIGNRGRLLPDILLTGNSLLNEYIDNCASSYYDFWKIITLFTRGSLVYTGEHNGTVVYAYTYKGGRCIQMFQVLKISEVVW